MVPYVQSNQVVHVNGEDFAWPVNPSGVPGGIQISTAGTQIIGSYWRLPQVQGPRVIGWQYLTADNTSVKPQPDALKVLSLKLTGEGGITNIMIAITDTDNVSTTTPQNQYAYLADGLGGSLPVMPTVTIPVPIMQQDPQVINPTTGAKTFIFAFPVNPLGRGYTVNGMWLNGVSIVPTMTGLTTVAGIVTAFNTAYPVYGTWSSTGDVLKLVSAPTDTTPVSKAGIDVDLTPTNFCFDLTAYSTPAAVDGIKFGSSATIPLTPFMLTDVNTALWPIIRPKMSAQTVPTFTIAHKLGLSTVQDTPKLYSGTTLVVASTNVICS